MKIKKLLMSIVCLLILIISGCELDSNYVGSIITPEEDFITAYLDTFKISATTIQRDSIFAKTTSGLLGEYFDPLYGRLNADFLCQFYCEDDFQFQKTPYQNEIDSIYVALYYIESGDPNSPFEFQVYPVTKALDKVFYTNVDPADYCDLNDLWGSQVYSAKSGTIIDSIPVSANSYIPIRSLEIQLPKALGQKFYEETVKNPAFFKNQQAFNDFFPGLYVTTGYGSGCMFNIQRTDIFIDYKCIEESSTGADSVILCTEKFITTKEVIQLNRYENSDTEQLLADNDDFTFIKTPAGIYTRLVIPSQEMKSIIEGRIINNMMLSIKYMPNEDWLYALDPPPHLLLLPEDSLYTFFHNRNIENNTTSFVSVTWSETNGRPETAMTTNLGYSPNRRTYYFDNINRLLAYHINESPDDDLRMLLVPVNRRTSGSSSSYYTIEISNYLAPSGVKLRKDNDLMQVSVVTSKRNR